MIFMLLAFVALLNFELQSMATIPTHNCTQPLGMEDGRILDSQITASSSYQEALVGPEKVKVSKMIV